MKKQDSSIQWTPSLAQRFHRFSQYSAEDALACFKEFGSPDPVTEREQYLRWFSETKHSAILYTISAAKEVIVHNDKLDDSIPYAFNFAADGLQFAALGDRGKMYRDAIRNRADYQPSGLNIRK